MSCVLAWGLVTAGRGRPAAKAPPAPADRRHVWGPPSVFVGALAGAVTVLGFAVVHAVWISDIWFNLGPMLVAGAACGACLAGSYDAVGDHSTWRWLAYNAACAFLLVALGGMSFLVLEPEFTMAELMASENALAELLPPALPLMVAAAMAGTAALWMSFGRPSRAILPLFVAQALLVFLVGHNLAILGLVEMSSEMVVAVGEFVGLTVFLAAGFAAGTMVLSRIEPRRVLRRRR